MLLQETLLKLNKDLGSKVFVETGSYIGDSIQLALTSGYAKVLSVELSDIFFRICANRFKDNKRVHLFHGDSADLLWPMIKSETEKITFWLDGHFSGFNQTPYGGFDTAFGKVEFPILEELNCIANHLRKDHIIMIDDIRCWKDLHIKYDDVINKLKDINKNYTIELFDGYAKDDILVAYI